MKTDIHLPTINKLAHANRRYCSFSASSFEQHGSIQHQGDSLNPTICLCDEAVNAALVLFDEPRWRARWEAFTAPVENNTDSLETKLGSHLFRYIKPHPLSMREEPCLNPLSTAEIRRAGLFTVLYSNTVCEHYNVRDYFNWIYVSNSPSRNRMVNYIRNFLNKTHFVICMWIIKSK